MPKKYTVQQVQIAAFIQHLLALEREKGETGEALGKQLGVTKAAVLDATNWGIGIGPKFHEGVARVFFDGSHDALKDAAAKHAKDHGIPTTLLSSVNPELAKAVEFMRDHPDRAEYPPNKFLDGWVSAHHDEGFKGYTRDTFITLIKGAWLASGTTQGASARLEEARRQRIAERRKK